MAHHNERSECGQVWGVGGTRISSVRDIARSDADEIMDDLATR